MKKNVLLLMLFAGMLLGGCSAPATTEIKNTPEDFVNAEEIVTYLSEQNIVYTETGDNTGDISEEKRIDTAENGQNPYAVIVTCSDSRVPVEHVFNAGIGELFVIRTAGNVIGDYELGSVEYGAEHLGAKLVVVLGHTGCGAVDAALHGGAHGNIEKITDEISACLPENCDAREAEILNIQNSIADIMESEMIHELVEAGKTQVVGAVYDIESGKVVFLDAEK